MIRSDKKGPGNMNDTNIAKAFESAMETADCETLIGQVRAWFDTPYRNPDNALGIVPCMASAIDTALQHKEDECRRNWRNGEAEHWKSVRQTIDAGIRRLVETIGKAASAEPQHDEQTAGAWRRGVQPNRDSWGRPSSQVRTPAIGAGWGPPRTS
jgi:hypothetical protein